MTSITLPNPGTVVGNLYRKVKGGLQGLSMGFNDPDILPSKADVRSKEVVGLLHKPTEEWSPEDMASIVEEMCAKKCNSISTLTKVLLVSTNEPSIKV